MAKVIIVCVIVLILVVAGLYLYFVYVPRLKEPGLSAAARKDTIQAGNITRTYTRYVPAECAPHPALVIVLHGTNINGDKIREWTGFEFDRMADEQGFLVVYPDGYDKDWNDCRKGDFSKAKREGIDDVGFIAALISHFVAHYKVEPARVYLFGYSSGGNMAFRMGMERPDLIAGIAAICASLPASGAGICTPVGIMPKTMLVYGGADKICPVEGGELNLFGSKRGKVISAAATADFFAKSNGVDTEAVKVRLPHRRADDPTSVDRLSWMRGGKAVVELYIVNNGGHVVPQQQAGFPGIMGRVSGDLDAPAQAAAFFELQ